MNAEILLNQLEKVRQTGPDQWIACCPVHEDQSPSLSIKNAGDRLLIHCFAGCATLDLLSLLGLKVGDLFDKPLSHYQAPTTRRQRKRYGQAHDVLKALVLEVNVALLAAEDVAAGKVLSESDLRRVRFARTRLRKAAELAA